MGHGDRGTGHGSRRFRQTDGVTVIVVLALGSAMLYGVGDYFGRCRRAAHSRADRRAPSTTRSPRSCSSSRCSRPAASGRSPAVAGGIIAGVLAAVGLPHLLRRPRCRTDLADVATHGAAELGRAGGGRVRASATNSARSRGSPSCSRSSARCSSASNVASTRAVRSPRTLLFAVIAGLSLGFATVALDACPTTRAWCRCSSTPRSASCCCSGSSGSRARCPPCDDWWPCSMRTTGARDARRAVPAGTRWRRRTSLSASASDSAHAGRR